LEDAPPVRALKRGLGVSSSFCSLVSEFGAGGLAFSRDLGLQHAARVDDPAEVLRTLELPRGCLPAPATGTDVAQASPHPPDRQERAVAAEKCRVVLLGYAVVEMRCERSRKIAIIVV
jgi:hypothetical protein